MSVPDQFRLFYQELGINLTIPAHSEDPTILREPKPGRRPLINYFLLLGIAETEPDATLKAQATRQRPIVSKKVAGWNALAHTHAEFYEVFDKGVERAVECFSDFGKVQTHREDLFKKRYGALEQRLLKVPADGKSAEPRIRADAKLMGFISTTEGRAVAELKQKYPLYFMARPKITSALRVSITEFDLFRYCIEATQTSTRFSAFPLPTGWRCNTSTGEIDGLAPAHGTLKIGVEATNAAGTGTETLTVEVLQAKPEITSPQTAKVFARRPFFYQITASNNPTSFGGANWPDGLTVDSTSGVISGRPLKVGVWTTTINASNTGGTGACQLVIEVSRKPGPIEWLRDVLDWILSLLRRRSLTTVKVRGTKVSPAVLTSVGALLVLGAGAAFIPFPSEIRTDLSLVTSPPQSMPAWSQFSRSPRSISTKQASSVWRILVPSKETALELGSLNDGKPESGWTFWSRQASHPVTMDFGMATAIEGVIVLNGLLNRNESRADGITLRFDNGTERSVSLQDTEDWQFVLFDVSTSQRIAVAAEANAAGEGCIGEMWFLERIESNPRPALWEGNWKSREGESLLLKSMTSGWFEGWLKTDSGDRRLFVRTLPDDLNNGPSLGGSIAQGADFVSQIEAQNALIRKRADAISIEIERRSGSPPQVIEFSPNMK